MNTFNLQTFDKHQGWQTLETFAHLTDADARQHEIEESNVEQGLDVKMRVQKQTASAPPENVRAKLDQAFQPDIRVKIDASNRITFAQSTTPKGSKRLQRKFVIGQDYDSALFGDLSGLTIES